MNKITKDNLNEFIKYYYEFHDSYITNVNYDISKSEIELLINVCWSGEPILKDDNAYQTNKTKMRMILNNVEKCIQSYHHQRENLEEPPGGISNGNELLQRRRNMQRNVFCLS